MIGGSCQFAEELHRFCALTGLGDVLSFPLAFFCCQDMFGVLYFVDGDVPLFPETVLGTDLIYSLF